VAFNILTRTVAGLTGASLLSVAAVAAANDPEDRVTVEERVVAERLEGEDAVYRVVQVVGGLHHPWALAWLPDGRMLVTERLGQLLLIGDGNVTALEGLPPIHAEEDQKTAPQGGQQGGLLDVALHPDYEQNNWIYFTYSSPGDDDGVPDAEVGTGTAVTRAKLSDDGTRLVELERLYAQTPRRVPGRHYGSRLVFPGDGTLIFSIGDRGLRYPSQDLTDPAGSMIRLKQDGGVYEQNPFIGKAPGNLRPDIHSFGHRNNQSLAIHRGTGDLWTAEHGPNGGDVLHVVEAGKNYGWPVVAQGVEYSTDEKIGLGATAPGIEPPVHIWEKAIAPSGMVSYDGEAFPAWRGNLFVGSLLQKQVRRLVLDGRRVVHEEVLLDDAVGRVRDVRQGPDGLLYVVTDESEGGVYRIEPVSGGDGGTADASTSDRR
jgi:aldose sugar dehydrogenase